MKGRAAAVTVVVMGVVAGLWCGRTLVDLRLRFGAPAVSAARDTEEMDILTAMPPGSLAAAYLEPVSVPDR
jgi:hypothetical protein